MLGSSKTTIFFAMMLMMTGMMMFTTTTNAFDMAVMSFHDTISKRKKRKREKSAADDYYDEDDLPNHMHVLFPNNALGPPEHPLQPIDLISDIFKDPNRNYCQVLTKLYGWEFIALADFLKDLIEKRFERTRNLTLINEMLQLLSCYYW